MTKVKLLETAKPILFNTEMVRAILDGHKTVTRRVVKPQPKDKIVYCFAGYRARKWGYPAEDAYKYWGKGFKRTEHLTNEEENRYWTPPCCADDILYVRETWALQQGVYWHKEGIEIDENGREPHGTIVPKKWHPSIHMPKKAARIFLRVTEVRVERLQNITDEGAKAEGIREWYIGMGESGFAVSQNSESFYDCAKGAYGNLWNSTILKKDRELYGWDVNPWVWVIEFERLETRE